MAVQQYAILCNSIILPINYNLWLYCYYSTQINSYIYIFYVIILCNDFLRLSLFIGFLSHTESRLYSGWWLYNRFKYVCYALYMSYFAEFFSLESFPPPSMSWNVIKSYFLKKYILIQKSFHSSFSLSTWVHLTFLN